MAIAKYFLVIIENQEKKEDAQMPFGLKTETHQHHGEDWHVIFGGTQVQHSLQLLLETSA